MGTDFDIDLAGENDATEELPPGVEPGALQGGDESQEESTPVEGEAVVADPDERPDKPWDGEVHEAPGALGGTDEPPAETDEERAERILAEQGIPAEEPIFDPNDQGAALDAEMDAAAVLDDDGEAAFAPAETTEPELPGESVPTPEEEAEFQAEREEAEVKEEPKKKPRKKAAAKPKAAKTPKPKSGSVDRTYFIFQEVQAEVGGNIIPVYARLTFMDGTDHIDGVVARNRELALGRAGKLLGHDWEGTLVAVSQGSWEPLPVSNTPEPRYKVKVG
jgi:hypothetical protein